MLFRVRGSKSACVKCAAFWSAPCVDDPSWPPCHLQSSHRPPPGEAPSHGNTTYFTVADSDGMMVSMIQSNFRGMGSGLVANGLGFMFQGQCELFSLRDGHRSIYARGKRPFQTLIPDFATRGGAPWMSFGVMGGDMHPQGQTQIIVNHVDYRLDIQAAGDSSRWHHEGSSQSMGEDPPGLQPQGDVTARVGRAGGHTASAVPALAGRSGPRTGRLAATNASKVV